MFQPLPDLPTNRAFVVQFRSQSPEASLLWEGRVEHLVSTTKIERDGTYYKVYFNDDGKQYEVFVSAGGELRKRRFERAL